MTTTPKALSAKVSIDEDVKVVAYGVELPSGKFSRYRRGESDAQSYVDAWNARFPKPPNAQVTALVRERDHLAALTKEREVADGLAAALEAVIRVADRKTDEFDQARQALTAHRESRSSNGNR